MFLFLLSERFPVCRDEKMTGMFREQQMDLA